MDAAQRVLSDQLDDATQRLLSTARVLAEPELRAPSLLPGWTRAHVLAHLARNADAMRNLLVGARSGTGRPAYASAAARAADIEAGYGPADWPAAFTALDLAEPMASQRRDRRSRPPG